MKKKISIILSSAFAFLLAFTLLGASAKAASASSSSDTTAQYIYIGEQVVTMLQSDAESGTDYLQQSGMDKKSAEDAVISWKEMAEKFGTLKNFDESKSSTTIDSTTGSGAINVAVVSESGRTGVVQIEFAEGQLDSISSAIDDTFAESLEKAGMNTVIGLLMAFGILSLMAIIIRLVFPQIYRLSQNLEAKKNAAAAPAAASAPAPVAAAPAAAEETEKENNDELAAVIAAAIAASEGRIGTDGFRVRSIRRHF